MNLNTPIEKLNKVGKITASRLKRLGIITAHDLLWFFPFRYEDFRTVKKISELKGSEMVTVQGKIELINNKRSFRTKKIITEALVSDGSDSLQVVWFGQPFIKNTLHIGDEISLSGKIKEDMLGIQMVSPVYEKVRYNTFPSNKRGGSAEPGCVNHQMTASTPLTSLTRGEANGVQTTHTARLVPIYPSTANLTQKQIRFLISQIINLVDIIPEWLPPDILKQQDLLLLPQALRGIHYPVDEKDLKQSTNRLKFDELFLLQLRSELSRQEKVLQLTLSLKFYESEIKEFVKSLPFTLTKAQKISTWEILQDLAKNHPMNRLLSGDVGSGKTVVAGIAMYNAVLNGFQCALMAPTEILAVQHYETLNKMLGDKLSITLLTSNLIESNTKLPVTNDKLKKNDIISALYDDKINIIIGTHALLSEKIKFKKLGLVVVDEQHRFGVKQRKTIKEKGKGVHFLSMTATPIPRSLALMVYGDLDVSIINELPANRKPILTRLVEPINRNKAYEFIRSQVQQGRQVFVVCPLIEERGTGDEERGTRNGGRIKKQIKKSDNSDIYPSSLVTRPTDDKKSVMSEYTKLSKTIFPELKIGYLHGKLKVKEKEERMNDFKNNKINILVSTSVIEVGIDIPNASVMMIEGAERFGLAQLHQFRGRVGRSVHQSYCFLFIEKESSKAVERLKFFEKNLDGFKLAEKDLEMRGPGEVYGTQQSGLMNLRLAKLTDRDIIKKARDSARMVVNNLDKYPKLIDKIKEWEDNIHLE